MVLTFILSDDASSVWITYVSLDAFATRQMFDNLTDSLLTTRSRTWILALIIDACKIWWAIRIQNTFHTTSIIWITKISWFTQTCCGTIVLSTYCMCSTWTRFTWISWQICYLWLASNVRIADKVMHTNTLRRMIDHHTFSIISTDIRWTWILAFFIDTCQIISALWIADAFRSTMRRTSNILGYACAWWWAIHIMTRCMRSTWWWIARIDWLTLWCFNYLNKLN